MHPARVLVVEDDNAARAGFVALLRNAGFACSEAATYRDAVVAMREGEPDLLITDVRLGMYNGLGLVIGRPSRVAAIVISGYVDDVLRSEAEGAGAIYLMKPVSPSELLQRVDELLHTGGESDGGGSRHKESDTV